jgi:hypothetical protein
VRLPKPLVLEQNAHIPVNQLNETRTATYTTLQAWKTKKRSSEMELLGMLIKTGMLEIFFQQLAIAIES